MFSLNVLLLSCDVKEKETVASKSIPVQVEFGLASTEASASRSASRGMISKKGLERSRREWFAFNS